LAERQYADALKASGLDPNIALGYVAFLQRRGDVSHAEDVLTEVVGRNPRNTQLLATLAQIKLARKNWSGALAVADVVSRLNDGRAIADQIRAAALAGQTSLTRVLPHSKTRMQRHPMRFGRWCRWYPPMSGLSKLTKREALLQGILKKYPDNAESWCCWDKPKWLRINQMTPSKAINWRSPSSLRPPTATTRFRISTTRAKNYDAAADVVQAALRAQPDNLNFRFTSAGCKF